MNSFKKIKELPQSERPCGPVKPFAPLEEHRTYAWSCGRCNWCKIVFGWYMRSARFRWNCPSLYHYKFDAYSAQGMMHIARALIEGEMTWKDSPKLLEIIYACQTCGACTMNCLRIGERDPMKVIEALRARAVELGIGPMSAHKRFGENLKVHHNVFAGPHEKRFAWMPPEVKPKKRADMAFFAGCVVPYKKQEIAAATARILKATGTEFAIMPDEWCCGSPLLRTGQIELAKEQMKHNAKLMREAGVKKLVTSCAGCYRALKVDYPEFVEDYDVEVIHTVELVSDLYDAGKIAFKELPKEVITYHDPCHMGRYFGVYEPPRKILDAIKGIELVEMERIKDQAWCCGAGGGVLAAFKDFALVTAKERLEEAKVTGASTLVSACPFCKTMFESAVETEKERIKIDDITNIIQRAMI